MNQPHGSSERPILEAVLESGEAAVKVLVDTELAEKIPFIGIAFKICRAIDSVRDRLLMAKMTSFLQEVGVGLGDKREEFLDRLAPEKDSQRVGSLLIMVLDNLVEAEKAVILGRLFVVYARGEIDREVFFRLTHAVNVALYDDLLSFLRVMGMPVFASHFRFMRHLGPSGLVEVDPSKQQWKSQSVDYKMSELGARLKNALHSYGYEDTV